MPDIEDKRAYVDSRVLIDYRRVLNPTFDDAVLSLTGGELEVLRNLMQYANRRDTFTSDLRVGYYYQLNDYNWDLIQQVVANLEETLMGNNNTVWGYTDRYADELAETSMPAGVSDIDGAVVPEGEVWEVTGLSFIVTSATCNQVRIGFDAGGKAMLVNVVLSPGTNVLYPFNCDLILKEGDHVFWRFYNLTLNDDTYCYAWGSKMQVPTV